MAQKSSKSQTKVNLTPEQENALDSIVKKMMTGKNGQFQFLTQEAFQDLIKQMSSRLINAALQGEMDYQLKQAREAEDGEKEPVKNKRNGYSKKMLHSDRGDIDIQVPRDRRGEYTPILIPKHARRFHGFDDAIINLYGRGMSTREISEFLKNQYDVEVSAEFISTVTDRVSEDVRQWQNRALETCYPVVFFDALRVNIRQDGIIKKMAVHFGLGVRTDGRKEVLGMWIHDNEGAAFWTSIFTELRNRGIQDIFIAVTDGLKGMTQAIEAIFPQTQHQTCIVHLIRASTAFISYKHLQDVMKQLKPIYQANTAEQAAAALDAFENSEMGKMYPHAVKTWRNAWAQVIPFFNFPREVRKLLYTTNSIEALNRGIRKVIKTRTMFPTEEAARKLIYLAIQNISAKWKLPARAWCDAMPVFVNIYGKRFTANAV